MKKLYALFLPFLFFTNLNAQSPNCTTNVFPVDGATNVNPYPSITFKWTPVAGATSYDVYISTKTPPKQLLGEVTADSIVFKDANYSTQYFWYVVPKNSSGTAMGCISSNTSFTTIAPPPPPSNDNCSGATNLTSGQITGNTVGATQSMPAVVCNGFTGTANDDVWYQYTPATSGPAQITVTGQGSFDAVMEAFSGNCGSLTSLTCSDTSQNGGTEAITINATAGTTYYFRVYNFFPNLSTRGAFTISGPAITLPISLIYFKGQHVGNSNVLSWSTANELNNSGFEVEYSFDGKDFRDLSFVNSKAPDGNSSSTLNYQYTDTKAAGADVFYRLKQVDKDGRISYSNVVFIKGGKLNSLLLNSVYPNPAKNKLNVIVSSPISNQISVVVTNLAGKRVYQQAFSISNGGNNLDLNVSNLPAGSYFIKAICNDGCNSAVSKFVKE
ncbi:MAG TPA: T9SS type A sorting domain-containing protein [Hanamia sp.]|nr:T9SS type A sorting domain-containing protein [Hanamia sp.]